MSDIVTPEERAARMPLDEREQFWENEALGWKLAAQSLNKQIAVLEQELATAKTALANWEQIAEEVMADFRELEQERDTLKQENQKLKEKIVFYGLENMI